MFHRPHSFLSTWARNPGFGWNRRTAFVVTPARSFLIDGERLADLKIQFNLGVSVVETIQLKEVDYDYFGG
jgi:restriction endonuclease Mrr